MDAPQHLFRRLDPNQGCTPQTCDPSRSIYGYRPNLAATILFLILFLILFTSSALIHTLQGLKTQTKFFTSTMLLGCLSELLGYTAKLLLWHNPFSDTAFRITVVLLTFAPAFYSAALYYSLKHVCLTCGAGFSRLRPALYTWVFVGCDVFSIVLQAVGGATASASRDRAVLRVGGDVMIAGLAMQVVTMVGFGVLAADYGVAVWRNWDRLDWEMVALLRRWERFGMFVVALWVAYFAILVRCCYRLAELAKGWGPQNGVLRNQVLFIVLDSVMCGIAAVVLNVWHPGYCLPKEQQDIAVKIASSGSSSSSDDEEGKVGFGEDVK